MKFFLSRVSQDQFSADPPCENAKRDAERWTRWIIEINTIEELMQFIADNGQVIIDPNNELTIYDDYTE